MKIKLSEWYTRGLPLYRITWTEPNGRKSWALVEQENWHRYEAWRALLDARS